MERYDANNRYHAWYEHWHRYHWVAPSLAGKKVADLACGEGYGSALLALHAEQVYAADIDQDTINKAQKKYQSFENLHFDVNDVLRLPLADHAVDAVVSFETLEHLTAHELLLQEFKRVLDRSGVLVISTPDKAVYSGADDHNEFHLKELTAVEFEGLIKGHFKHSMLFGQQFQTQSLIVPQKPTQDAGMAATVVTQGDEFAVATNKTLPTYLIAVASDDVDALSAFTDLPASAFNDAHNSLFKHYEQQVINLMATDRRMAKLEQQLQQQSAVIRQLQARLGL